MPGSMERGTDIRGYMRAVWFAVLFCWSNAAAAQSILVMGDSILIWNSHVDASVPDVLDSGLGDGVVNNAAVGAMLTNPNALGRLFGYDIRAQYEGFDWDWVVLNGGANDLLMECGCGICDDVLEDLSTSDGRQGAMPDLVNEIRDAGAQIVLLGYYMPPSGGTEEFGCIDDLSALNERYRTLSARDVDVYFLNVAELIPRNDLSLFDADLLHPSPKGSRILGNAIVELIEAN
ncbi:MAG: SGNH/GDSL hydrolase family protein [Pseudomonadota bacterium]